jgi:glycosyltransferase involved in cell wall biosynthesis
MNIIMDFRKFDGVVGGVEQGVVQVVSHASSLGHKVTLLSKSARINEVRALFAGDQKINHFPIKVKHHGISMKNAYHDTVTIQKVAQREHADIIHFPYNWSFPFVKKFPSILTIHDVIPFTFREAMGYFKNHLVYKPAIRIAACLNTVITTVSEFSKGDICQKLGVPEEKIRVIPNGLRVPDIPVTDEKKHLLDRYDAHDGYVLNVGGIHERKNEPRLIRAFSLLVKKEGYQGKLIITGSVSGAPYQEKMKKICDRAVSETDMAQRVVFTGFISEKELDHLYSCAQIFIYPSLYEGFGIPVLEAMKIGTPVITSNIAVMKEVAGDAAVLIDADNTEEIAGAMNTLLNEKSFARELIQKGKKRAAHYSWDKTANEYLALYEHTAHR